MSVIQAAMGVVQIERLLPGPIELVWDYLTKPEYLATWLTEGSTGSQRLEVTRCQPLEMLEYSLSGNSAVRFELETRGPDVLLRLTHRRLPAVFAGVCMVVVTALLSFMLDRPAEPCHQHQLLGLKFHSSASKPLYGILGGRC